MALRTQPPARRGLGVLLDDEPPLDPEIHQGMPREPVNQQERQVAPLPAAVQLTTDQLTAILSAVWQGGDTRSGSMARCPVTFNGKGSSAWSRISPTAPTSTAALSELQKRMRWLAFRFCSPAMPRHGGAWSAPQYTHGVMHYRASTLRSRHDAATTSYTSSYSPPSDQ